MSRRTNQSDALSPGTVGQFYCCGNLVAARRAAATRPSAHREPGPDHRDADNARAFSLLVRVTDSRGAFAERTFSITIS